MSFEKNVLDFCFETPINSYNFTSYIGGVMFAKDNRYYPYYLSDHIVLTSDDYFDIICNDIIMFDDEIFELKELITNEYKIETVKEELFNMIDEGYYISATVDEYYIPNRYCYGKESFYHDMLLYGYDREKNIFYTAGYDISNKFNGCEYSIDLVCETLVRCLNERKTKPHFHYFRCKELDLPFRYDDVKFKLGKYLTSEQVVVRENDEGKGHATFGTGAYDGLIERFNYSCDNNKFWRRASFNMLCEHKKMMVDRVQHINEHFSEISPNIIEKFEEILKKARAIQMKSVKYLVKRNSADKDKIVDDLKWMQEMEYYVIENLLKAM